MGGGQGASWDSRSPRPFLGEMQGPWPSGAEHCYHLQRADGNGGAGASSRLLPLPLTVGGKLSLRVGMGSLFWNLHL